MRSLRWLPAVLVAVGVQAAPIFVTNHSFESPVITDGGVAAPTGWTTSSSAFAFNPTVTAVPTVPDGSQVLFLQSSGSAFQALGSVLTVNTIYTLTIDVGSRADFNFIAGYVINLEAGASVLTTSNSPLPANGSFITRTLQYTALPGDPNLGQTLGIRLTNVPTGSSTALMDNVRLDASPTTASEVPEPSTLSLLGAAVAAAGLLRKSVRRQSSSN